MEEQKIIELGRRAVACSRWRWLPGMLARREGRVCSRELDIEPWIYEDDLPDLRDPATLGCLLHLVREACGSHEVSVRWCASMGEWACEHDIVNGWRIWRATEAEALVRALEAEQAHAENSSQTMTGTTA